MADFMEQVEKWRRNSSRLAREGSRGMAEVWVDKEGHLTKFLSREPGNHRWAVNPRLFMAFNAQYRAGLAPRIVYCFQVELYDLGLPGVPHDPSVMFGTHTVDSGVWRPWHECNPTAPNPKEFPEAKNLNWYFVEGPGGEEWENQVFKVLQEVNAELRPLGLRAEVRK